MLGGGARAVARCDALGVPPYSDMAAGLYRGYLTPAHRAAVDQVGTWMAEAGMRVVIDPAANLLGRYEGATPEAPALIIASHIDSVRDGGRYDGPLGVLLGIECVAALEADGKRLPFAIEIYAFGDEEGSRFPAAMLTSRAVAGTLALDLALIADSEGQALAVALRRFTADDDATVIGTATRSREALDLTTFHTARRLSRDVLGYFEAHIEQGPILEAKGLAIGTVTGIAAQLRYQIVVAGTAGHAGTTSMPLRHDALAGAAEMVLAVEAVAFADESDLVATVGWIEALPGAANVIPGCVRFTIDVRAGDPVRRDAAAEAILPRLAEIAGHRGLALTIGLIHDLPASPCDPVLMDLLDAATAAAGQPICRLVSGAGHDAMVMAALCPTAMLFVRCKDGISHNPAESVDPADVEIALTTMLGFIDRVGERFGA
ncbi:MAG: allantoate amidohydrolase [Sphingomonadaceae bacterium]|nr:allantoate amidohydrolase [Sphingomonadaceae bacterium]